jgi:magnesium transporter
MERLKEIEIDSYLPVIVLTAQPEQKLRALKSGAKDFVSKPFDLAEVLLRVRNMLEVRLLHQETKNLYERVVAEKKKSFELTAQPGAMVGVKNEVRLSTPWLQSVRLRLPWLQLNLLTSFAAAAVVGLFQGTIDRLLILTIFLPVLADQSGNAGSQALAITLRGLVLGDLKSGKEKAQVLKEALLGLMNGTLVGLVAGIAMYGVARVHQLPSAAMLSVVVFISMVGSCVISGVCGAVVPLVLKRLGKDPVTASSIFLTTATNMASMGLFLGLASLLVK